MNKDGFLSHEFNLSAEKLREISKAIQKNGDYIDLAIAAYCKDIAAHSYNYDFKLKISYKVS
ncbi:MULTISPECIES: hypothetical protein [unclassified Acinetobacter]|nr:MULTISPECIES: hypothetical protein [unclassified Acinetobacter]